eukprot:NODE_631_length_5203_cov_0.313480.p5 type:complete len:139 gc:universal NODE_631_length_5203_cov_0.313480:3758-4174(+)
MQTRTLQTYLKSIQFTDAEIKNIQYAQRGLNIPLHSVLCAIYYFELMDTQNHYINFCACLFLAYKLDQDEYVLAKTYGRLVKIHPTTIIKYEKRLLKMLNYAVFIDLQYLQDIFKRITYYSHRIQTPISPQSPLISIN